ncbi:MAG: plastocyanin/azurin family copper-binding protein [Dehalococcoidia bacterium]
MIWAARGIALALIAAVFVAAAVALAAGGASETPVMSATIGIHFSKFTTTELTVRAGEPVSLTLANQDPIGHEWIVGDEATHARHRTGAEPYHDQVPTEVSLRAFETRTTVVSFEKAGDYAFICHLPGHEEYGMRGVIHVVSR